MFELSGSSMPTIYALLYIAIFINIIYLYHQNYALLRPEQSDHLWADKTF